MVKKFLIPFHCLICFTCSTGLDAQWENPLVYYQFNETNGSLVVDSSGHHFNSNINCENCWSPEGKFDGSLQFQGLQKMDLPAEDIGMTNEQGTVAFWVLLPQSSASTINCIWWAGEYGGDTFGPQNEMHINTEATEPNIWVGGELALYIRDSLADDRYFIFSDTAKGVNPANPPSEKAITLTDGVWHHVACTWDSGGTVSLYIDGKPIWDSTSYHPNPWEFNIMTIGAANERSNRRLNGTLDEFRMYDVALNAGEVEAIYNYVPEDIVSVNESTSKTDGSAVRPYPNPAGQSILFLNSLAAEMIEIYSLTGERLMEKQVSSTYGTVEFNIEHLSPGIYFIRAIDSNQTFTVGRFIKQ